MGACFLLWCLGQGFIAHERVTITHDIRDNGRAERLVSAELPWVIGGFVEQTAGSNAVFAGTLPLRITALKRRLAIEGGAVIATTQVPHTGTRANFMTRVQLHVTSRVALTYWHWSNANIGRTNPGMDAVGLSVGLRRHPH